MYREREDYRDNRDYNRDGRDRDGRDIRDRDRDRDSRDRDRDRDIRDRERDRDRDRSPLRDEYRERDRDRRGDRDSYYSKQEGDFSKQKGTPQESKKWKAQSRDSGSNYNSSTARTFGRGEDEPNKKQEDPTNVVMMRGLNYNTVPKTIKSLLQYRGFPTAEPRIIKNKDTGESRGFAFIDFGSVEEAQKFVSMFSSGSPLEIDGREISLDYSRQALAHESKDWICDQCQGHNFARRTACFQCYAIKPANPTYVGDVEKESPCTVLLIKGLDLLTSEEILYNTFATFGTIKEVRLIRDKVTRVSKRFAFVEYHTVEDASNALQKANGIRIDESAIRVTFARKPSGDTPSSGLAHEIMQQAQWAMSNSNQAMNYNYDQYAAYQYSQPGQYPAGFPQQYNQVPYNVAGVPALYAGASASANNGQSGQSVSNSETPAATSQTAGDVGNTPSTTSTVPQPLVPGVPIPPMGVPPLIPGVIPVGMSAAAQGAALAAATLAAIEAEEKKKKKKKEKESISNASAINVKKIEKEIEKWNKSKQNAKAEHEQVIAAQQQKEKEKEKEKEKALEAKAAASGTATPPDTAATNAPTQEQPSPPMTIPEDPERAAVIAEIQQTVGLICILCKRQFNSPEVLKKHIQISDLHKQNLEVAIDRHLQQKRDRDLLKDQEERERKAAQKEKTAADTPSPLLDENSFASKMMKKMGWAPGEGLGREGEGMTAPIEVTLRSERAGLGMEEASNVTGSDSYQSASRKRARARFETEFK